MGLKLEPQLPTHSLPTQEQPRSTQGRVPTFDELVEFVAYECDISSRAQLFLRTGGTRSEQIARQVLGYLVFKDIYHGIKDLAERFALAAAMLNRPESTIRYTVRTTEESRNPEVLVAIARVRAHYAPDI